MCRVCSLPQTETDPVQLAPFTCSKKTLYVLDFVDLFFFFFFYGTQQGYNIMLQ